MAGGNKELDRIVAQRSRGQHIAELAQNGAPSASSSGAIIVAPPKKSGGGGLLHGIASTFEKTGSDLYHAAINTPAGLVYLGKGLATHPVRTGEQVVKSTVEDLKHPLRHPGYTLLDLLGVAGGAAGIAGRVGAVGSALEEGASAGDLARAALTRAVPEARTLRSGDLSVKVPASKAPLTRAVQKGTDALLHNAAEKNPAGRAAGIINRKIGKAVTEQGRTEETIAKGPGAALVAIGRKLKPHEQKALQVVAEEAPLDRRITAAAARVTGAKDVKARARHQEELDLLHQAKPLLGETDGKPVFSGKDATKLNGVLAKMRDVAGTREELLKGLGLLTDESVQGRKAAAARVAVGEPLDHPAGPTPPTPGQMSLLPDEQHAPLFEPSADAVRIPDTAKKPPRSQMASPRTGSSGVVGRPKEPGSVTHSYTGALRENALRRQDTAQLVGESGIEAGKYAALHHVVDLAKQAAHPEPLRPDDLAVRLDELGKSEKLPADVRKYLDDPHSFFAHATDSEKNQVFDKVRQQLIIDPKKLDPVQAAEFQKLHAEGKIGFVPKAILGDYAKPQAPLAAVAGSGAVKSVDAINNASRFAILYLKPAYAIPNLLGNAALNLIQQGFAAPANLSRAVALTWRLGPEETARIDTLMGEGFARAVSAHGQGKFSATVDKAASVWSKGVDTPFRRAAFIHEARAAGFRTPDQMRALLTDPAKHQDLVHLTVRANREIIDYGALSPAEREIVRRVVFFYPWVKGSTKYAAHMVAEHPVAAATQGQIGKQGREWTQNELGPVPSYLEGILPVGKDKVSNPASAAILNTPAQVGAALAGLAHGNVSEAAQLSNFASPALNLALSEIARRNLSTGAAYPGKASGIDIAKDVLGSSLPQMSLYKNLKAAGTSAGNRKLYPPSKTSALEQFLIGSIAPRKINKSRLRGLAVTEQRQMQHAR